MKRALWVAGLAVAAFALAANGIQGTEGDIGARSADGRIAQARFRAVRETIGVQSRTDGRLRFEQMRNQNGRAALIEMGKPAEVVVDGNVCRFRGPGVLSAVDDGGHRRTFRGPVLVSVTDGHNPDHPDGKDLIEIHFQNAEHNINFQFAGEVGRGNLAVFVRNR